MLSDKYVSTEMTKQMKLSLQSCTCLLRLSNFLNIYTQACFNTPIKDFSRIYILMQGEGSFTVTSKIQEKTDTPQVGKFKQLTITIQREGSVALTHTGTIGKNEFSPALQAILSQMRQGERWQIADQSQNKFVVEVVEIGKNIDSKNHLELADALKLQGNAFIKSKDNLKAVAKYQQAYNLVVNDPTNKAYELKLSLISNLALAYLNLSEFRSAISWCNLHLEQTLEPNLKIVYRKANSNKGIKNWAQAKNDIEFGIANSANDAESLENFKKLLVQLEKQEKMQEKKEKAVYGKMFG